MPEGLFVSRIAATRGEVWIPSLGVLVARMEHPVLLRRREVADPELGLFDLHAAVSYFNLDLWQDRDFTKTITLWIGKKPLKVTDFDLTRVVLVERNLRIEGVNATWQPKD